MHEQGADGEVLTRPSPEPLLADPRHADVARAIETLHDLRGSAADKVAAIELLGVSEGGDHVAHALLGALHHTSPHVRGAAAFALGRLGELHGVGPLVTLLQDPIDDVRCRAAVALGLIGSLSVLRTTSESPDPDERTIRWAAIQALGNLGAVAVECLAKALRLGPAAERARVVMALGETREVTAVGPLAEVLNDDDPDVRARAREALEKIRESRVF
ncbi:MAG: HEAT repeat domain-containing protein [Actinomycetota bacterium]